MTAPRAAALPARRRTRPAPFPHARCAPCPAARPEAAAARAARRANPHSFPSEAQP